MLPTVWPGTNAQRESCVVQEESCDPLTAARRLTGTTAGVHRHETRDQWACYLDPKTQELFTTQSLFSTASSALARRFGELMKVVALYARKSSLPGASSPTSGAGAAAKPHSAAAKAPAGDAGAGPSCAPTKSAAANSAGDRSALAPAKPRLNLLTKKAIQKAHMAAGQPKIGDALAAARPAARPASQAVPRSKENAAPAAVRPSKALPAPADVPAHEGPIDLC